jgi:hypothetical protein
MSLYRAVLRLFVFFRVASCVVVFVFVSFTTFPVLTQRSVAFIALIIDWSTTICTTHWSQYRTLSTVLIFYMIFTAFHAYHFCAAFAVIARHRQWFIALGTICRQGRRAFARIIFRHLAPFLGFGLKITK